MTVLESFERFIKKCQVKNLSEVTIKNYNHKCKAFIQWIGPDADVSEITAEKIDDFTLELKNNRNINDTSVVTEIRHIRAFVYFCMDNGYISYFKIRLPRAEKKEKQTYSEDDIMKLIAEPKASAKKKEHRAYAFVNFLIGTGVRLGTAINVRVSDIDFENGYIHLDKTKSRREYSIPLSTALSKVLTAYIEYMSLSGDDMLFPNARGEKASERSYQHLVQWYNNSRGVKCTSCHAFRHSFAKSYILNGGNTFKLQKILSHANISTTKEYVDMFGADLKMDFDVLSPLDNRRSPYSGMNISFA